MGSNGEFKLKIENLQSEVEGNLILKGVDLALRNGEVHAIMGPNGSGKSTLANTLMGNPNYRVVQGRILLDGKEIQTLTPTERARLGIFLAFQYPSEIPGVKISSFLRTAYNAVTGENISAGKFMKLLKKKMRLLDIDEGFVERYLNDGFSGGEKKRNEMLQMAILEPEVAILDETDSGLDIDALKVVATVANKMRSPERTMLVITHYQRILRYLKPDFVHILMDGRVVRSGGPELADLLEERGYDWIKAEVNEQSDGNE